MSAERPVSMVPDAELAYLPLPIRACPRCGSLAIHTPRLGEGGIPGTSEILTEHVCPRCDYRGPPLEFARREDYAEFVRELNE